ncbi:hypothetical protein ISP15_08630 [Dyella jejuensis]|uniref:DUF4279 domain-containing protein n=1 Tax=Dyella jejuensis TaxID=1432009 RepID=A0ABW8JIV9_9GAMM
MDVSTNNLYFEHSLLIQVSLYLKGKNLIPEAITEKTNIQPDITALCGTKKVPGRENSAVYKTSIWGIRVISRESPSECIRSFLRKIKGSEIFFANAPGIDEAYIDFFYSKAVDIDQLNDAVEFEFESDLLEGLKKIGVPVRFTISNIKR